MTDCGVPLDWTGAGGPVDEGDIVRDLKTVAQWHLLCGKPDALILSESGLLGSPDHVVQAWQRLKTTTATDFVSNDFATPVEIIEDLLLDLDDREIHVLERRLFADVPETLESIGADFGVSRERIRQVETAAVKKLLPGSSEPEQDLFDLGAAIRQRVGVVGSIEYVLEVLPSLAQVSPSLRQPAWRIVDRIDETFEIADGWVCVPDLNSAVDITRALASDQADAWGLADKSEIASAIGFTQPERDQELVLWITHCGMDVYRGKVVSRARSIPDWACVVLVDAGTPLTSQEICDRIPVERAERSVRNALLGDERILRVDRGSYGLVAWGLPEYEGIRAAIGDYLDAANGTADIDELTHALSERFAVAPSSVRAYAAAHPFEVKSGMVTRRSVETGERRTRGGAKRTYTYESGFGYRIQVTPDHLRGSGSILPAQLARRIGLREGSSDQLSCPSGPQTVYWTGIQPALGSIRRVVEDLGLQEGSWVLARFSEDSAVTFRELDCTGLDGLELVCALTGVELEPDEHLLARLGRAFDLPEGASWAMVISTAAGRGEDDIADALLRDSRVSEALNTTLGSGEGEVKSPGVNEILDLL